MSDKITYNPFAPRHCEHDALSAARSEGVTEPRTAPAYSSVERHSEIARSNFPGTPARGVSSRLDAQFVDPWRGC